MAITIRSDKGSQLTYNELDNNFVSFFYSASISSNQEFLNLHYTGSSGLSVNASSIQIPLNPYTGSNPPVAGATTQVQFNNAGSFGGDADFIFDSTKNAVGIGQVTLDTGDRLAVRNGVIRNESTATGTNPKFLWHFDSGSTETSASIQLVEDDGIFKFENEATLSASDCDSGMQFIAKRFKTTPAFEILGTGKIRFRNADHANGDINISGSLLIDGNAGNINRMFRIRSVDSSASTIPFTSTMGSAGNARGVVLDGPDRGHVIVGLQSSVASQGASQTFSILSGPPTSSNYNVTYNNVVAMFKANGQVGIGTHTVATGYELHVAGDITGSSLETSGAIKAKGNISGSNKLYVSGSSTLSGSVTINTIANASSATNYDYLVHESGNVVKQVNAAPIPKGGIIMWSGTGVPSGFALCDGNSGTQINGVTIPDLRDKFIVGAGSTYNTGSTGGATTHNHGGATAAHTLNATQIPAHDHTYKDSYFIEVHNLTHSGAGGYIDGQDTVTGGPYKGSGDSDNDNNRVYWRNGTTNQNTGGGGSHTHNISAANHLPPYYALAFIIYTG